MVKRKFLVIFGSVLLCGSILFLSGVLFWKRKNAGEVWKPASRGRAIEVRALPRVESIVQDYENWLKRGDRNTVRVYEVIIQSAQEQQDFQWRVVTNNTPIPGFKMTHVSFRYKIGEDDGYHVSGYFSGRKAEDKFLVGGSPKKIWLKPVNLIGFRNPRMQLVAIEGLKADWIVSPSSHKEVP